MIANELSVRIDKTSGIGKVQIGLSGKKKDSSGVYKQLPIGQYFMIFKYQELLVNQMVFNQQPIKRNLILYQKESSLI